VKASYRAKGQTERELSRRKQGNAKQSTSETGLAVGAKLRAERKRSGRSRYQSNWGEK
jgi:hypothetical protein